MKIVKKNTTGFCSRHWGHSAFEHNAMKNSASVLKSNFYACIWLPAHQRALLSRCYSTFLSVWAWTTAKAQLAALKLCSNTKLHSDWSYCFPIWKKGMLQWYQQRGCNLLVLTQNLLDGLRLTYIRGHCFPIHVQSLILLAKAFKFVDYLLVSACRSVSMIQSQQLNLLQCGSFVDFSCFWQNYLLKKQLGTEQDWGSYLKFPKDFSTTLHALVRDEFDSLHKLLLFHH